MGRVRIVSLGGREDGWLLPITIAAWGDEAGYCIYYLSPNFMQTPVANYCTLMEILTLHTSKLSAPVIINKPTVLKVVKAKTHRSKIAPTPQKQHHQQSK
jgi:hypothetical protein